MIESLMHRLRHLIVIAIALLISCSAPSTNTSDDEPDLANLPQDRIAEMLFRMWCERDQRCQDPSWSDVEFCTADRLAENKAIFDTPARIAPSIAAAMTDYDPDAFRECLLAIRSLACGLDLIDWNWRVEIPACGRAFQGQHQEGESCLSTVSCPVDNHCVPSLEKQCDATCQKIGVGCVFDGWCRNGEVCDTSQKCRALNPAPGMEGQPCGERFSCVDGLACLPDNGTTNVCTLPNGIGGHCGLNGVCGDGAHCDGSNEQCVPDQPVPPIVGANESCGDWWASNTPSCAVGLICVPSDDGTDGRCLAQKKSGETCTKLLECGVATSDLICDTKAKKCVDRPKTGPCPAAQFGDFCSPLDSYCDREADPEKPTCRLFKKADEECTDDRECGFGGGIYCWHRPDAPAICTTFEDICE